MTWIRFSHRPPVSDLGLIVAGGAVVAVLLLCAFLAGFGLARWQARAALAAPALEATLDTAADLGAAPDSARAALGCIASGRC